MKDKRNIKDDLSLMQIAYGVALVHGFKNVIESIYDLALNMGLNGPIQMIKLLSGIILMITMIRFFWALGNIRRYIIRNDTRLINTRRYVITFHFFVLLLHAFALFSLAKYSQDISIKTSVDRAVPFIVIGYIAFLLFNSTWLAVLVSGQEDKHPEKTWITNNVITSILAISIFCISVYWSGQYFLGFLLVFPVFMVNCIVDFVKTSSSYVSVDEAEGPNQAL